MKINRIILVLSAITIISIGVLGFTPSQATPSYVPDNYIIILKDGANPWSVANEMAQQRGLGISHVYETAIHGFSGVVPKGQLDKILSDPRVKYVEQDSIVTIFKKPSGTPGGGGGGSTTQPPQVIPTGIARIGGSVSGSINVDVAVIDTGIDPTHPDLNVVDGVNFAKGNSWSDGNGHGTHVAGTIAAKNNDIGVVGVAPDARLHAVRVLDNRGSGFTSDVIAGVNWVAANADIIEVANMSLGGSQSNALNTAVENAVNAGVVFVVAAGNESTDACSKSPASAPNAITVSALDDRDGVSNNDPFASFSNYGSCVDVIAPGVLILSTWKDGGYNTISGTSMATPHVAGAAALYLVSHPTDTPAQVVDALQSAGNIDWNVSTDPDGIHEKLIHIP
ncbi:S8 family peptidase [Candidatus Nitrosarchaeum limnium]|uniref:Peptidase families S8 and S53 n=1 Tax=Candidatus Nitrosarchaeum limnium BG20 TaxID=859192 RepID=S2E4A0_9ARCH|nr:S8 family peptidase [Candidatus Nitrosarchaeum limnium]EPA06045.1 peptidase families S8 and S53 [Candidatus Nitrosarchaeum limnium BG20]